MLDMLDAILVVVFAQIIPLLVTAGCLYVFALALITSMKPDVPGFDRAEMLSMGLLYLFTCIWFWGWIEEMGGNSEPGYAHAGVVVALILFLITMGFPVLLKRTLSVPYIVMAIIYTGIMLFGL